MLKIMSTSALAYTMAVSTTCTTTTTTSLSTENAATELKAVTEFSEKTTSDMSHNETVSYEDRLKSYKSALEIGHVILFDKYEGTGGNIEVITSTIFHKCIKNLPTGKPSETGSKKTQFFLLEEGKNHSTHSDLFDRLQKDLIDAGYQCQCDLENDMPSNPMDIAFLEAPLRF